MKTKSKIFTINIVAAISLLLLIPLAMIKGLIKERENTKDAVVKEVATAYALQQTLSDPELVSYKNLNIQSSEYNITNCLQVDYKADVKPDKLHRSIYDVIVYNSKIQITGKFPITAAAMAAKRTIFRLEVSDYKGFGNPSKLSFGEQTFDPVRGTKYIETDVTLPHNVKAGEIIDFTLSFDLKGTESLFFKASRGCNTSLTISSPYPHPSFQGTLLPDKRDVRNDGFEATWNVSEYSNSGTMGVKFVDPANPYQQSMRSAKYGLLIIILVFVAGLFIEIITRKEISPIQYAVIGLSLVLFYSLLLSFSEFISFGVAYAIAALMTTIALMLYFRAILKNRSTYIFGGFVAIVYALNYLLLQMETYALLTGSLILFLLLCGIMYLTVNINNKDIHETE